MKWWNTSSTKHLLRTLPPEDIKRPSLLKQNLAKTERFEVLFQDLGLILNLLQQGVEHTNRTDNRVVLVPSLTRFSQKQDHPLYLGFLNRSLVVGMSLHLACTITAKDPETHLMWSRYGLQETVGLTTKVFSALGMHEVVNVQTALDKRQMELKHSLLAVFAKSPLRFVQMYVDSPHVRLSPKHLHPVSCCIVLCGLQHHQSRQSLLRAAQEYVEHIRDCALKMVGQLAARVEYVTYIDQSCGILSVLRPEHFFNVPALDAFLSRTPVVVPFCDSSDCSLVDILNQSLEHISSTLMDHLVKSSGKGGFVPSWHSFQ